MDSGILKHYSNEFSNGRDVLTSDTEKLFDAIISNENEQVLAGLLSAWADKGTSENELFDFATIMRSRMKRVSSRHPVVADIVGTGGSRSKRFNVSTAAAFVTAGAGVVVAKHGNRAATSDSGSADVLDHLGIRVDLEPNAVEDCLNEIGICFMFAPKFHSLSPTLATVRRRLGRPTIFNNLGPLCNPAGAQHQVIGVWSRDLLEKTANVLAKLGNGRSWVVHGSDGLDELTLDRISLVAVCDENDGTSFDLTSSDFGFEPEIGNVPSGCSSSESALLIREILGNERSGEASEQLVLMNAAAAIHLALPDTSLPMAFEIAKESICSGAALQKLTQLAVKTNE